MLNSGPSGFHNAPVTKGLLLLSAGSSVLFSMLNLKNILNFPDLSPLFKMQFWRLASYHVYFTSPGELLFGIYLLYFFRIFERQMGSVKFSGFISTTFLISTLLQIGQYVLFPAIKNTTTGPYSVIFACLMRFHFDIPPTYRFRICGINANDKLFTYIIGLQLLFSNFPYSLISGVFGIGAGIAYRTDTLKLNRFRFPPFITNFFSRFILPMLQSPPRQPQRNPIAINPVVNNNIINNNNNNNGNANVNANRPNQNLVNPGLSQGYADTLLPGLMNNQFRGNPYLNQQQRRQAPSEETISALTSMGFSREIVIQALDRSNNDVELATNLLLDQ